MMNKPSSARAHLAQYALVLPLAVALLAFTTSWAGQSASSNPETGKAGGVKYYLDGQPTVQSAVEKLNTTPDAIANVQVVKGEAAQALTKDAATDVVAITTKGNERLPAVQMLNAKIIRLLPEADTKPEEKVVPISNLHPDALAYITQHFPGHRLVELLEVKESGASEVRYKAVIAMGRRPKYVVFDTQGKALGSFDATGKPLTE